MKIKTNEIARKYGTPMNFEYDPRSNKTLDYALRLQGSDEKNKIEKEVIYNREKALR